jgi:O-antigen ligase
MKERVQHAAVGPFFGLVTFWFAMEYLRPQDYLPGLGMIRPALLLFLFIFAVWVVRGDKSILGDNLVRGYLAFIAVGSMSVFFAANTYWAVQDNLFLISFLFAGVLPFISFMDRPEALRRFFNWWVFFNALVAVAAIMRGGRGSGSFMEDENDLALTLAMSLPFAYFLGTHGKRTPLIKAMFIIAGLAMIAAIVVTRSRGGFLGLMMAGFSIVWFSRRRVRNLILVALIGMMAAFAIVQLDLLRAQDPNDPHYRERHAQSYLDEMSSIQDATDATRVSRLYYWGRAWQMFKDNPVFGVGTGNFGWRVEEYEQSDPGWSPTQPLSGGRVAHSIYFTLFAEYGLVGSAIFVALGVGLWNRMKRVRNRLALIDDSESEVLTALSRACSASLLAFLVSGAFLTVLYYPHFWYLLGFAITLERASLHLAPEPAHVPRFGHNRAAATRA